MTKMLLQSVVNVRTLLDLKSADPKRGAPRLHGARGEGPTCPALGPALTVTHICYIFPCDSTAFMLFKDRDHRFFLVTDTVYK